MYKLTSVARIYQKGRRTVPAVRDLNLTIEDGEWLAVQGRTGSGKSTLLNLLGGLDRPTEGTVELDGADLGALPEAQLTRLRATAIGFVFQNFNLVPTLSAAENVESALIPLGTGHAGRRRQVAAALEQVGLADRASHLPAELSGGQQQRVAIARALVKQPRVLLAGGAVLFAAFALRQRRAASPLITPSLLRNKGFTSGLILGLAFFAALAGLTYLISLFFQLSEHYSADKAALALSPMAFGFVSASLTSRPLVQRLGRALVVLGLAAALAGALGLWATVLAEGTGVTGYLTIPSVYVLGLGIGTCITSLYDVAIGDVTQDEAGSASGSFSAVQQLASAIGAAVVTSIYFKVSAAHGGVTAMTTSAFTVAMIIVACLGLVWLLPRTPARPA